MFFEKRNNQREMRLKTSINLCMKCHIFVLKNYLQKYIFFLNHDFQLGSGF